MPNIFPVRPGFLTKTSSPGYEVFSFLRSSFGIAVVEDDGLDSLPGMKLVREGNVLSDDDIKRIEVVGISHCVNCDTWGLTDVGCNYYEYRYW